MWDPLKNSQDSAETKTSYWEMHVSYRIYHTNNDNDFENEIHGME
jgi:hypothetical protein